jgi:hypothetical protein
MTVWTGFTEKTDWTKGHEISSSEAPALGLYVGILGGFSAPESIVAINWGLWLLGVCEAHPCDRGLVHILLIIVVAEVTIRCSRAVESL